MITSEKIKIYKKYIGDIDSWSRSGSNREKLVMNDKDWYIIDGLVQDFSLVNKGLASLKFKNDLNNRLVENCDNERTINELKSME